MPRLRTDVHRKVRELLSHSVPLGPQAQRPIQHFESAINVGLQLLRYIQDHIDLDTVYEAGYSRHLGHLGRMALAEMIESFERFLKELAAACVDSLARYCLDDRFDEFLPRRGDTIAAFVNAQSIGKALCESDTWINNKAINDRFSALLQSPFGAKWEPLFPSPNEKPAAERERAATLAILWQVRHNLAHNLGVITHSDAKRFRVMIGGPVEDDCRLAPDTDDLKYIKRFLSESAEQVNVRVGTRLAELLTAYHASDAGLFDAQAEADALSRRLDFPITIDGRVGTPS